MIYCLIIDDEPIARKGLKSYVKNIETLHLVGECDNALQAQKMLEEHKVDLIFLDIHMPLLSGIDFLKTMNNPPLVIITTAYSTYALEGYSLDVLDYLVKPISFERFITAVNRVKDYLMLQQKAGNTDNNSKPLDYFFIKCDTKFEKINYKDILFIQAMQNYVIINTTQRKYIAHITFKSVENYLPSDRFLRVQKSFIIPVAKIDTIDGNSIKIGKHSIPISRDSKEKILKLILDRKLLKKQRNIE